jgi:hypothetical protein
MEEGWYGGAPTPGPQVRFCWLPVSPYSPQSRSSQDQWKSNGDDDNDDVVDENADHVDSDNGLDEDDVHVKHDNDN